MDIDIRVLGPVELRVGGQLRMHGAAKALHLLAALALDAGRPVPLDTLAGRIWDDSPPAKPRASLHSYAARIRHHLGQERVTQSAHAYLLDVAPDAVDQHRFRRCTAQARSLAASGNDAQALGLLREAESLWHGVPLTGFTGLWSAQARRRLMEQQLEARVLRAEIMLRAGRYADTLTDLTALSEQHPEDETVAALFMTAAYGSGRQSQALRAYESLRRRLRDHGADPGQALARVHRGILRQAPADSLLGRRPPGGAALAPDNLPAHSGVLLGRADELRALRTPPAGAAGPFSITGMPGVGKTELALHAARMLAGNYPSAQLYLNLQGHSGRTPLSPQAALTTLLRHLGVPTGDIPHDIDELSALWRTVLGARRAVVVLDDAAGSEQVRPLLPGTTASLVIVTSRRRLAGLSGVRHTTLDVLSPADAEALLTTLVEGAGGHDPAEVAALARLCAYLPMALDLIAARLRSHPTWSAAHLVGRLTRGEGRLAEMRDGQVEISDFFAYSYDALPAAHQRVFRLLGLHFGPTFCTPAAAALAGLPTAETERVLDALLDAHLIREPAPERYDMHDLLAAYARSRAEEEPAAEREAALARLAAFYVHAMAAAHRLLFPRQPRLDLAPEEPAGALPAWAGEAQAREWLHLEFEALTAAELHLRGHGDGRRAACLAHYASEYLEGDERWAEAEDMHAHAAEWWRRAGEPSAEAHALVALAAAQSHTGRYEAAGRTAERALTAAVAVGDRAAEAQALRVLGLLHWDLGRLRESLVLQQRALDIREELGDTWYIARYRNNVGIGLLHLGDHAAAMQCFREALAGFVATKDWRGEAQALNNLGEGHSRMGEPELAQTAWRRAVDLFHRVNSRAEEEVARLNLALTMPVPEQLGTALDMAREALAVFREIGSRRPEAVALNTIGTLFRRALQDDESAAHHTAALALARSLGTAHEEMEALRGLGEAELHSGRTESASGHLSAALLLAREIGASEEEAKTHSALADWHMASGRIEDAARHLRVAYSMGIGLNPSAAARTLTRLRSLEERIQHTRMHR
ncbi:MAG: tetratricopeptide repeat protein [Streptomyces sp.]|nr:tetratricopeptide repeat protein [Streptomyces sp.]